MFGQSKKMVSSVSYIEQHTGKNKPLAVNLKIKKAASLPNGVALLYIGLPAFFGIHAVLGAFL